MSKNDIISMLESTGLIGKQITQTNVMMFSRSLPEDDFPICEMKLIGISDRMEADIVSLTVCIKGNEIKTAKIPVVKGDRKRFIVTADRDMIREYIDTEAECSVMLHDKFGRELASVSSVIEFGTKKIIPTCIADISFNDEIDLRDDPIRVHIADISLGTDINTSVCIEVSQNGEPIWQENVNVTSGGSLEHISIDASGLTGMDSSEFIITVRCDGNVISRAVGELKIINKEIVPPVPKVSLSMNILGEVELPEYVDTHRADNDIVRFGSLFLVNKDSIEHQIMISIVLDGKDIFCSRECLRVGATEFMLEAPFLMLLNESTYSCELITHITDCDGSTVLHKISTLKVRSKYDIDLDEINTRTAQFVNPLNVAVKALVDDSDGPLAKAMAGRFSVTGYQLEGKNVYKQAEAVYRMMHDVGMCYVSDTFTLDSGDTSTRYQHVRTPDKILGDRSGNCIELSIFYASMIEAMGMEPVIIFPKGHAVAGVVLATDLYRSTADVSGKEMDGCPIVEMTIGNKKAFVLVIETTMCPFCRDFIQAAEGGYSIVEKQLNFIIEQSRYCFIKEMRLKDINPMIDL